MLRTDSIHITHELLTLLSELVQTIKHGMAFPRMNNVLKRLQTVVVFTEANNLSGSLRNGRYCRYRAGQITLNPVKELAPSSQCPQRECDVRNE
jgi:hypothetical protein